MKKRFLSILILVTLILPLVLILTPSVVLADTGLVVGTTTENDPLQFIAERRAFFSDGRFWLFYDTLTVGNIGYLSSSDGVSWSDYVSVYGDHGSLLNTYFDGTYIHYVYLSGTTVTYRCGDPQLDGTITWLAAEQVVTSNATTPGNGGLGLAVDDSGYAFVVVRKPDTFAHCFINANNNGTWSTASDTVLSSNDVSAGQLGIIPLTGSKMLALYYIDSGYLYAKAYNGTNWGDPELVKSGGGAKFSATSHEDTAFVVGYYTSAMWYKIRTPEGDWSGGTKTTPGSAVGYASLCSVGDGSIRAFLSNLVTDHIYYIDYVDGAWETYWTDWIDESSDTIASYYGTCNFRTEAGKMTYYYTTGTSPYSVKLAYFSASQPPTVLTNVAILTTDSSTTLQGTLSSIGDYSPVYAYFEYGLNTSYGTTTIEQTKTSTGGFNQPITSLTPDTTYHYRAVVRYSASSYVYGDDDTFITEETPTVLSAPTNFKVSSFTDDSITLTWTKGTNAVNTVIRRSTTSYPTSPGSGDSVYSGTGTTVTDPGLVTDTTYYYSAWSEAGGSYSTSYATKSGTPSISGIAIPDSMLIESVEVYNDYLDGQLYVIAYKLTYEDTPPVSASDYFRTEILEGVILRATGQVTGWQYRPAAIYLAGDGQLTWGESYIVELVGFPNKWSTPPSTSYELTASSWRGSDLTELDTWVINLALRMQEYYSIDLTTWVPRLGRTILNEQGGEIFRNAIPGLASVRPELFSSGVSEIEVDQSPQSRDYEEQIANNFGEEALAKFTALGSFIGLSGTAAAGLVFFLILILVVGGLTAATGSGIVASVIAVPLVAVGGFLGVVPLALIGVAGGLLAIYFFANLWLARS